MRLLYLVRYCVGILLLVISSAANSAIPYGNCMLITDKSDPIFLYHAATGEPIDTEIFLNSLSAGSRKSYQFGGSYNNIFGDLVADYDAIRDVFAHVDFINSVESSLPDIENSSLPEIDAPLCIWKKIIIGHYDFDSNLFPIEFYRYGSIDSHWGGITRLDDIKRKDGFYYSIDMDQSIAGYDNFFRPPSLQLAREIESQGHIKALFIFDPISESAVSGEGHTLTLRPRKIEFHAEAALERHNFKELFHSPLPIRVTAPLFVMTHDNNDIDQPQSNVNVKTEKLMGSPSAARPQFNGEMRFKDWQYASTPSQRVNVVSHNGNSILSYGLSDLTLINTKQKSCDNTSVDLKFHNFRKVVGLPTNCKVLESGSGVVYSFSPNSRPDFKRIGRIVKLMRNDQSMGVEIVGAPYGTRSPKLAGATFSLKGSTAAIDYLNRTYNDTESQNYGDWRLDDATIAYLADMLPR